MKRKERGPVADLRKEQPEKAGGRGLRGWMSFSFTCLLLGAAAMVVMLLFMRSQALPVSSMSASSEMYDVHGELIEAYGSSKNRQAVTLQEISPQLVKATLAVEDRNFYEH